MQQCGQSECGQQGMNEIAEADSHGREQGGLSPLRYPACYDIDDIGARRQGKNDDNARKEQEIGQKLVSVASICLYVSASISPRAKRCRKIEIASGCGGCARTDCMGGWATAAGA